jgi:predicted RNase H-like HicB family nuclease
LRKSKTSRNPVNRPFDPAILRRAAEIAGKYQVILQLEGDDYIGRGLELPNAFEDGKTPDECVSKTREMFVTAVATMLEDGEVPPPPASEGKRTEQVNVRLSADEKLILETTARRRGYAGLADYMRAVAIAGEK